ncbi:MAG: AmmeMemoRadiSam system protein A [Thiotrichales bacterium]|nr:AmmeMemoRadiSam system protein A [Thiotrichales bacterium]
MYSCEQQQCLLHTARSTIENSVRSGQRTLDQPDTADQELLQRRGNFVTLMLNSRLRGCIGSVEGDGALIHSVSEHAWSAAFRDPRFSPVQDHEVEDLHISVSVLTPKQAVSFSNETELLRLLRPGVDGLLIERNRQRATFLPSVWEQIPDPPDFLRQLKIKAGMHATDCPSHAWTYTAISVSE